MAHEVFVSYSQPDRNCAFELTEHLEANGLSVWIAPRDVAPSSDWAEEIIAAISGARVMVLVFSASSNDSPQVRREVERAVHKKVRILPFRIEEVVPSGSLEYFLSTQHWLDGFPPPPEHHYAKLCAYLNPMLSRAGTHDVSHPARSAGSLAVAGSREAREPCVPVADLGRLEAQLASYIGPIARVLIARSASVASSVDDLLSRLAGELDSKDDQKRFLAACQWLHRPPG